jgi:hypothetical protein
VSAVAAARRVVRPGGVDGGAYYALAAALAESPGAAERLLALHTADADGLCSAPGCGRPGYGTACTEWPCAPAALAMAAVDIRAGTLRRLRRAGEG